jgi:hypothetical protein
LAGGCGYRRRPAATADARAAAAGIAGPLGRRRRALGRTRTRAVACAATKAARAACMGAAAATAPTTRAASTAAAGTTTATTTTAGTTTTTTTAGTTTTTTTATTAGLSPGGQTASVRAGQRHDRESRPCQENNGEPQAEWAATGHLHPPLVGEAKPLVGEAEPRFGTAADLHGAINVPVKLSFMALKGQ